MEMPTAETLAAALLRLPEDARVMHPNYIEITREQVARFGTLELLAQWDTYFPHCNVGCITSMALLAGDES